MQPAEAQLEALLELARKVRAAAHAPYSQFRVGAALLDAAGRSFSGCNVENLSFGLTVCAERNAIAAAVAAGMQPGGLMALVLVGDTQSPLSPCGACRQVIAEFAHADCRVIGANLAGQLRSWRLSELLPEGFKSLG